MAFFPSTVQHVLRQRVTQLWQQRQLPHLAQRTCELYLNGQDPQAQTHCQEVLQTQIRLDAQTLQRFLQTDIGEFLLQRLEQLIQLPHDAAGRQALVQKITRADQLSIMSLLYQIAGNLRTDRLLETAKQIDLLLHTTDDLLSLLTSLMQQESLGQSVPAADPRLPGPGGIRQRVLHLQRRFTQPFKVVLYEPVGERLSPISVVVISHGLAANSQTMAHYAKHLVSHGYLVAVPQHPGSDTHQVRNLLAGTVDEIFSLQDFFDRPQDISALLDKLEQLNEGDYDGQLNLADIGILGESFGGYTALALAGATIDFEGLAQRCDQLSESLNVSLLLQCRALSLPTQDTRLHDPRIKAIFTIDPIGSGLFGPDGLAAVSIPTVIATGSRDKTAPMALEPMQLFPHLAGQRFLAVIRGKSHVHDMRTLLSSLKLAEQIELPSFKSSPPIIDSYLCGLSVLFFDQYLKTPQTSDTDAVSLPAYAQSISQPPYDLSLISAKSAQALCPVLESFQQRLSQLKWHTITVQHQDGMFTAADGLSLYYQSWLPTSTVKATIVLVHGLGGHSGLFQNVVKALIAEGYALYGYDLRGHGRSPGQRGHINRWVDYRHDLACFVAMVQSQHPTVPCFLLSHSLGSIIALDYALHRASPHVSGETTYPEIAGIVAASLPLGTHATTNLRLKIGQLLSLGWPRFSLSLGLKRILPSRDRAVVLAYAHDPLRHQKGTARLATEFLKTVQSLYNHQDRLTVPLLMLHGSADKVADYSSSHDFFRNLSLTKKTFIGYDGAYHELYNESNQADIMADINTWLDAQIQTD
ncbi:alpha/beta fold hydrolase [Leptolyngbya cf. ectocarpi LEGE 11479]|uniref:Alpha/beta fold hydrolase n=1 Tax=Leptolyngbya cf. ectocarpi LEGE 11479 TaxID=1828722 RepID=A0A928ZY53_LEPEC|nr:alpha/beta fold hydrolase [Leptolyngbya ectocarpi]MBE9069614.1 alpha/beta fold hydrolase [Leptolyngbya cf. ectocarpi LEGE 11479]